MHGFDIVFFQLCLVHMVMESKKTSKNNFLNEEICAKKLVICKKKNLAVMSFKLRLVFPALG